MLEGQQAAVQGHAVPTGQRAERLQAMVGSAAP